MDTTNIVIQAAAVTMFVKVLVDIVKISPLPAASAVLPLLTLIFAAGVALLLDVAQAVPLTKQTLAIAGLVAIMAAGGAAGVTQLQNKGNQP